MAIYNLFTAFGRRVVNSRNADVQGVSGLSSTAIYKIYKKIGGKNGKPKKKRRGKSGKITLLYDKITHFREKVVSLHAGMEHQQYQRRRVCAIRVEPYLATYALRKFDVDERSGAIRIPDSFDLYHCVWQLMERRPRGVGDAADANLKIWLPARRGIDGIAQKNPAFWNYLSPRSGRIIEKSLRRLFNWEFHHYCENLISRGMPKKESVRRFIRLYGLGIDCEDALLKNLQRHERTVQAFLGIKKGEREKKRRI